MIKDNYEALFADYKKYIKSREDIEASHGNNILHLLSADNIRSFDIENINKLILERKSLLRQLFNKVKRNKIRIGAEAIDFNKNLGFFDTFLGGFFGNKDRISRLNEYNELVLAQGLEVGLVAAELELNLKTQLKNIEFNLLKDHLFSFDPDFFKDTLIKENLLYTSKSIKNFLFELDRILNEINSEETPNTFDSYMNIKDIGVASPVISRDIHSSIKKLQSNMNDFYFLHKDYLLENKIIDINPHSSDNFKLLSDFLDSDNADMFMNDLYFIREEIQREADLLSFKSIKLDQLLDEKVRSICKIS